MKTCMIYLHGRGGSAAEAARYQALFPACDVVGFDYRAATPWEAEREFLPFFRELRARHGRVVLIANSIGAYLALAAGADALADKSYLISPVADMEALIRGMMARAGVTETELRRAGEIKTEGETLSYAYLTYVRAHPLRLHTKAEILYGEHDALTPPETIRTFAAANGAGLTVMPGGEHWFHTAAQMDFLDDWLRRGEEEM